MVKIDRWVPILVPSIANTSRTPVGGTAKITRPEFVVPAVYLPSTPFALGGFTTG